MEYRLFHPTNSHKNKALHGGEGQEAKPAAVFWISGAILSHPSAAAGGGEGPPPHFLDLSLGCRRLVGVSSDKTMGGGGASSSSVLLDALHKSKTNPLVVLYVRDASRYCPLPILLLLVSLRLCQSTFPFLF